MTKLTQYQIINFNVISSKISKQQRKASYSREENLFLADTFEEYKDIWDIKYKNANTNKKTYNFTHTCV